MSHAHALLDASADEAVEMATYASLATRIEPELLRALRIELMPGTGVGAEADLWFGPLVRSRGLDGIVLDTRVADVLRERLAERYADPAERDRIVRARRIVATLHERMSPALALEEQVVWLVVSGADTGEVDAELSRALAAVADGRTGVASWAEQAWYRLPPRARASSAGWELRRVGAPRRKTTLEFAQQPREDEDDRLVGLLDGHGEIVWAVAYSPDGRLLASAGGAQHPVRLWDAGSGAPVATLGGHEDTAFTLAFSPDGLMVASGSGDGTVRLWDVATHEPFMSPLRGGGRTRGLAFSPDGASLASSGEDGAIRLWDVMSGPSLRVLAGHGGGMDALAFSPDGRTLASGGPFGAVWLWDVAAGSILRALEAHEGEVWALAFSPDGATLVSAGADHAVRLWDPATGKPGPQVDGVQAVWTLAFSPDGRTLAAGGTDGAIRLWDTGDGAVSHALKSHAGSVNAVAFSPDGSTLASGGDDGLVRVWDMPRVPAASVALGVRRDGSVLELGAVVADGAGSIRVPDTEPRLVEILRDGAPPATVAVARGDVERIEVGDGAVRLRAATGEVYELPASLRPPAGDLRPARVIVLGDGTGDIAAAFELDPASVRRFELVDYESHAERVEALIRSGASFEGAIVAISAPHTEPPALTLNEQRLAERVGVPTSVAVPQSSARAALAGDSEARRQILALAGEVERLLPSKPRQLAASFVMPVASVGSLVDNPFVRSPDEMRIYTSEGGAVPVGGRIERGTVTAGDAVEVVGGGRRTRATVLRLSGDRVEGRADEAVVCHLVGIEPGQVLEGDVLCEPSTQSERRGFHAVVFVLPADQTGRTERSITAGRYEFMVWSTTVPGQVLLQLDGVERLNAGEYADLWIELDRPVPVDAGTTLSVIDAGLTVGLGVVSERAEELLEFEPGVPGATPFGELLERYRPLLRYDSREKFFAGSAAMMTDNLRPDGEGNTLRRADGTVLASAGTVGLAPPLSLSFLSEVRYPSGMVPLSTDVLHAAPGRHEQDASRMQSNPAYADVVYGHAALGRDNRVWLQYWFFYYYDDTTLFDHEGDWEMIQVGLDREGTPTEATYASRHGNERLRWIDLEVEDDAPIVYVARGSHACYARPGNRGRIVSRDRADGRGDEVRPTLTDLDDERAAWVHWPGLWGGTPQPRQPLGSASPHGPPFQPAWIDPAAFHKSAVTRR